jgi:hypothetical protein
MFYILLFGLLAVLLVVAGMTARSKQQKTLDAEHMQHRGAQHGTNDTERRKRKASRAQSRNARRKRH